MVAAMRDQDRPGADLRALLELVEAASPTDAIEVVADELAARVPIRIELGRMVGISGGFWDAHAVLSCGISSLPI